MDRQKRKISAGTLIMLIAAIIVLAATVYVLARLSSGTQVDLTRLRPGTVDITEKERTEENPGPTARPAAEPTAVPAAEEVPPTTEQPGRSLTLTVGGTVSLVIMGESINVKATTSRSTSHLMSFGTSDLVPEK